MYRHFLFAGVLGAVTLVLSVTPLGLIPVPSLSTYATTMHIPAIIGGIVGGPLVGALVGCILALFTMHLFWGILWRVFTKVPHWCCSIFHLESTG